MKGYLHKIEDWFVIYDQRTMQDPSAEDGMLPLHPNDVAVSSFSFYNGKEVEFEIRRYDGTIPILNAWNGYAKLVDYDENGKRITYWGGLKDRTCTNSCSVVCGECQILHISDDCEEVKNWDNFVEQKNKELVQKLIDKDIFDQAVLAMEEHYGSGCETEINAYFRGAKWMEQNLKSIKNLYTEEQVIEFTMNMISQYVQGNTNIWNRELLNQSLKKN